MRVTLGRMFIERAKPPRKVDLLLRRQVLVPEDEDMMVQMRPVNAGKVRFVDWAGRVEADDLGPERVRKWTDHEGHGCFSACLVSASGQEGRLQ
jgi:hypothetical protein